MACSSAKRTTTISTDEVKSSRISRSVNEIKYGSIRKIEERAGPGRVADGVLCCFARGGTQESRLGIARGAGIQDQSPGSTCAGLGRPAGAVTFGGLPDSIVGGDSRVTK